MSSLNITGDNNGVIHHFKLITEQEPKKDSPAPEKQEPCIDVAHLKLVYEVSCVIKCEDTRNLIRALLMEGPADRDCFWFTLGAVLRNYRQTDIRQKPLKHGQNEKISIPKKEPRDWSNADILQMSLVFSQYDFQRELGFLITGKYISKVAFVTW
eukprot:CAMPEP_0197021618 /NCGR_PEP_ID=MMETSP1384-20130603/2540_1 /TAXON_ID=29189 /ORGANISM="Ammonia sp." /LENGTH=154 /DNA_ID=CAMNT_0042449489 /DNA_START=61 /DNA_END=522 /DNA_ORIENTATION=+